MSQAATKVFIFVIIFWSTTSFAKCGRCPLNDVHKRVDHEACSSYKENYNGFQNTFSSYFDVDVASGRQLNVPITNSEDSCISSELVPCLSALYALHSEAQCSRTGNLDVNGSEPGASSSRQTTRQDVNGSWSSNRLMFHLPDGGIITCLLEYRELGRKASSPSVNSADQTVLSPCKSHLLYRQASFSSKIIEIEKHQSLDSSFPRVNISPSKLDWGQNYLYHASVASLKLRNSCNETVLKVYVPFSTDTQFYPFNFSEVELGPGEVTSVSFVFLPQWLGSSSAELIVQTSFGSFLVEAKGFAVESPHRLTPLVGLDVSSGGWLSRKLSLWNPFDEAIHLGEVTTLVSKSQSSSPFLAEGVCSPHKPQDLDEHSFSNTSKLQSGDSGQLDSDSMAIRPLSDWVIVPHRNESILEMTFSPDSEGQVLGAICIQLLRPLKGEKDTIVLPFEATLNKTASLISVSMEAVGSCHMDETTVSIFVRNSALHLLKIIGINEVFDTRLLQLKFSGEVLLFPGTITLVALVAYESSNVSSDSFLETADVSKSCVLHILTNDTSSPNLEVPCQEIFGICSRKQQESSTPQDNNVDFNNRRAGASNEKSSVMVKEFGGSEVDEYVLKSWRDQKTMSGLNVLDDIKLLFPMVTIGGHYAKSITVKNPSQQPVIVQLILNSGEIMENCKDFHDHLQPPSSNSFIHNDSTTPTRYGFSMADSSVTEAYLHPYGTASLGPILFHPSNRCEWKSSALIRSNLSGVEWLSLHGSGGLLSLVLFEDSELMHGLEFSLNLPSPLNMSSSDIASNIRAATFGCHNLSSKKLFAVNAGDFPVEVKSIHVSGTECRLDGFVVQNCKSFSLEPGESREFGMSYQTDFSSPVVQRDLELMLASGILVIPMKGTLPLHMLNFCRKSIFWVRVKKCCVFVILATILISLLFWLLIPQMTSSCSSDHFIEAKKRSIPLVKPRCKSTPVSCDQNHAKTMMTTAKHGDLKPVMIVQDSLQEFSFPTTIPLEPELDRAGKLEVAQPVSLSVRTRKDRRRRQRNRKGSGSGLMSLIEVSSSQSGNSTPTSPLSPITSSISPKETYSPSPRKSQPLECSTPSLHDTLNSCDKSEESEPVLNANALGREAVDTRNPSESIRLQPAGQRKTGNRPMLLPSATFPRMGRSTNVLPSSTSLSSSLAVSRHARAPGPKSQKVVHAEAQAKAEDRFAYDIWGNHFSGLHLMSSVNDQSAAMASRSAVEVDSGSFFLRGPQQTLFTNCRSRSVK